MANDLQATLAELSREVHLLGDRIRSVAPSPLDEVGLPAGKPALGLRPWALGNGAPGSRFEALSPGGATDEGRFTPPLTSHLSPLTNSRVLDHIENRSLGDWISAEVMSYDRKELREAVAKLREMVRKLLEDVLARALGLGNSALRPPETAWLGALGSGLGGWAQSLKASPSLDPLIIRSPTDPTLATEALGVGADSLSVKPRGLTYPPLTSVDRRQAIDGEGRPLLSASGTDYRSLIADYGRQSSPDIHFHIHDAAAVGPILRNKDAMLVRTAGMVERQRAVTRRPRGR